VLDVRAISKRFGDIVALDEVSLQVRPGELLGFLGPNGSGKTTTMRSVMGLIALDSGAVYWNGEPTDAESRHRFGYMPAERGMYPKMGVRDQLVYFSRLAGRSRAASREAADRWIERMGLTDRATAEVQSLSSGNQQRVQLAIALVHDPELLILDEPFSGLDPVAVEMMKVMLLEQAARGVAVLFSSHQLDLVADVCRDVVIVDRGRIVLNGNIRELRERSPLRRAEVHYARDAHLPSMPDGWRVVRAEARRLLLSVPAEIHHDQILSELSAHGDIVDFAFGPPELSEVFVSAVGRTGAVASGDPTSHAGPADVSATEQTP
jgi:ABC-2 type transport system ATP-binding protein